MNIDFFRPVPFYFLNTVEPSELDIDAANRAMEAVKAAGFGGIVLFNKPPTGFDASGYLSDFWFDVTENFIKAGLKHDLQMWINDGFNYPPGDAGGRIKAANPRLKQLRLVKNAKGQIVPQEVSWGFPAFEEPESSSLFIEFVYEEYYRRLGKYFGQGITGFFSDADNRRINSGTSAELAGNRYYPWSKNFSAIFKSRFGYAVEPYLPSLLDGEVNQAISDYWLLCGELYQKWFQNNYEWCRSHGIKYTFHTSDTGPFSYSKNPRSSAFTEGLPLELLKNADMPGTDHEILALDGGTHYDNRLFHPKVSRGCGIGQMKNPAFAETIFDVRAKYAASAAIINGKSRVMCEMFAASNWGATHNNLRRVAAWQIMQGVNFIVPHAVHHKLSGTTKFFAPPEFLHGSLRHGLREFNDYLAKYCFIASQGEYVAPVAVIDPTPEVWKNRDTEQFFKICDHLNRQPLGYIICNRETAKHFPITIDSFDELPELPESGVNFTGGDLGYMHRRLDNGEEYLMAANLWNDTVQTGTLTFNAKSYDIELFPGEIAVFGGPYEEFRAPGKQKTKRIFSAQLPVIWGDENIIPFEQNLSFSITDDLKKLRLLVPDCIDGKIYYDGHELTNGVSIKIFDDKYKAFELPTSKGRHEVNTEAPADFTVPFLLSGEFDAELETSGDFNHKAMSSYMLEMYLPAHETLTLKSRSKCLDTSSGWEKQGHPFYSGTVEYRLGEVETASGDELVLPMANGVVELLIDGITCGKCIWPPYRFKLENCIGRHSLSLKCYNSLANQFERYAAPSGLAATPELKYYDKVKQITNNKNTE